MLSEFDRPEYSTQLVPSANYPAGSGTSVLTRCSATCYPCCISPVGTRPISTLDTSAISSSLLVRRSSPFAPVLILLPGPPLIRPLIEQPPCRVPCSHILPPYSSYSSTRDRPRDRRELTYRALSRPNSYHGHIHDLQALEVHPGQSATLQTMPGYVLQLLIVPTNMTFITTWSFRIPHSFN